MMCGGVSVDARLSACLVSPRISLVDLGNLGHQGVVGVGIGEQRADAEKNLGDGKGRAPLLLEDIEADAALAIHVGMVHLRLEVHLGRLEGIIRRKLFFSRGKEKEEKWKWRGCQGFVSGCKREKMRKCTPSDALCERKHTPPRA